MISILTFFLGSLVGFGLSVFTMSIKLSDSDALRVMILRELLPAKEAIDSLSNEENRTDSEQSLRIIKNRIENACKRIETS